MIKIFFQQISFTSQNTQARDLLTLENNVNGFLADPMVISDSVDWQLFTQPATTNQYVAVLINYHLKR